MCLYIVNKFIFVFVGVGQGWILSDLWIIHDTHVPRGPDRNRALMHLWVHGVCKSNGRQEQTGESNIFTDPTQGSYLESNSAILKVKWTFQLLKMFVFV